MNSPSHVSPALQLCCYVNATCHIQVAQITDIANWDFERVVFPGQRLLFEAPQNADLEIHTTIASMTLSDVIPCKTLKVRTAAITN